jgi:hypothetical protein
VRKHTEGELLASLRLRIASAKKRRSEGGSNTVSMSYAQAERLLEMAKRNCKKCDQLERELADALLDAALHRNAAEQLGDMARDASPKCKKCDYPNCFCERKGK